MAEKDKERQGRLSLPRLGFEPLPVLHGRTDALHPASYGNDIITRPPGYDYRSMPPSVTPGRSLASLAPYGESPFGMRHSRSANIIASSNAPGPRHSNAGTSQLLPVIHVLKICLNDRPIVAL